MQVSRVKSERSLTQLSFSAFSAMHVPPINELKHAVKCKRSLRKWPALNLSVFGAFPSSSLLLVIITENEGFLSEANSSPLSISPHYLFLSELHSFHSKWTLDLSFTTPAHIGRRGARVSALHGESHPPQHLSAVDPHQQEGHLEALRPGICGEVSRQRPTGMSSFLFLVDYFSRCVYL